MKKLVHLFCATVLVAGCSSFHAAPKFSPVAVVELFTSEGCSSCPPADKLLAKTIAQAHASGAKIYCLAFHVDYWNRLGWKDSFSSAAFSERQRMYGESLRLQSVYTPQIIVNGAREFVGSDEDQLEAAVQSALNENALASFKNLEGSKSSGQLMVSYQLEGAFENCEVNVALVSKEVSTAVKRGENAGRLLKQSYVVRQLANENAKASGQVSFSAKPIPDAGEGVIVGFIREKTSGKIIGAAEAAN